MSVGGKKRHSEKRRLAKKSAKAARRALYESYAKQGRSRKRDQNQAGVKFNHETSNCGNPGCNKCFPHLRRPTGREIADFLKSKAAKAA